MPRSDGKDSGTDALQAGTLEFSGGRAVRDLIPGGSIRLDPCGVCVLSGSVIVDFRYPGRLGVGQIALGAGFWAQLPTESDVRAKSGARLLILPTEAK